MKFKGQGKINICGFEYKQNIADSRGGGGGGVRAPKKNPCIRAWGVTLITFAGALLAHDDGWQIVSKMVRAVPLLQGRRYRYRSLSLSLSLSLPLPPSLARSLPPSRWLARN